MIKTDKKVRIGSELKKMEQEYQEERSEYKFRPQKRDKGLFHVAKFRKNLESDPFARKMITYRDSQWTPHSP